MLKFEVNLNFVYVLQIQLQQISSALCSWSLGIRPAKPPRQGLPARLYGLFVPRTIRTLDYLYYGWTIRTLDYSYDGLFVPLTRPIRTMDCLYHL